MRFGERGIAAYQASKRLAGGASASSKRPSGETADHLREADPSGGHAKAAKFLTLLGKEEATKILRHLSEEEVEAIVRELAALRRIDKHEAQDILAEFGYIANAGAGKSGGIDTARQMLAAAFGEEEAQRRLRKAYPEAFGRPFAFLDKLEFQQIMLLLKGESSSVISLIIPHMDPRKAAQVLEAVASPKQREVVQRVSRMRAVDPEVLDRIGGVLKEKIRRQGKVATNEVDGTDTLSQILEHMDPSSEQALLRSLQTDAPELGEELVQRLFTMDVLCRMSDQDAQAVLRDFSDQELALVLKGKRAEIHDRVFDSLSERRRRDVEAEEQRLGAVTRQDAERATREFLDYLRDQAEQGRWSIRRGEDDEFV